MKRKVERLASSITEAVSRWDSVECVTLGEHSEADVLDPYFALVIDVYLRGSPPTVEERQAAYAAALGQPGAFESSVSRSKDRFFIEELPVRIEYKNIALLDNAIARSKGPDAELVWVIKNSGTYMFYRLQHSRVLYQKSDWIERVRRGIAELSPAFWDGLRDACQSKMEHYLSDLGAASCSDDGYFYSVSLAGFVRYTAASIFMANKRLEPSHREMTKKLAELPSLPEDFLARWDSLLSSCSDLDSMQKYKLAELLALGVINLP
jgi:hypothetical protein